MLHLWHSKKLQFWQVLIYILILRFWSDSDTLFHCAAFSSIHYSCSRQDPCRSSLKIHCYGSLSFQSKKLTNLSGPPSICGHLTFLPSQDLTSNPTRFESPKRRLPLCYVTGSELVPDCRLFSHAYVAKTPYHFRFTFSWISLLLVIIGFDICSCSGLALMWHTFMVSEWTKLPYFSYYFW